MVDPYDEDASLAELIYEETCICDTDLCNIWHSTLDFYCHGGDFDLNELQGNALMLNETHNCYTNREQCYIMIYNGKSGH